MAENAFLARQEDFDHLLAQGFTEIEARNLISMKEHVGEEVEYQERCEEEHRLAFIRWLVQNNRISK